MRTIKKGETVIPGDGMYVIKMPPPPTRSEGGVILPMSGKGASDEDGAIFGTIVATGVETVDTRGNRVADRFPIGSTVLVLPNMMIPLPHPSKRLWLCSHNAVACALVGQHEAAHTLEATPYCVEDL